MFWTGKRRPFTSNCRNGWAGSSEPHPFQSPMEGARVRFVSERMAKPAKKKPALAYNFRRVKGAGVFFVLLWNLLVFSYQTSALVSLMDLFVSHLKSIAFEDDQQSNTFLEPWLRSVLTALLFDSLPKMLYPFAGWLADGKLGRYKVMRYSLWMMWVGSFLLIIASIVKYVVAMQSPSDGDWEIIVRCLLPVYVVIYLISAVGTAGYHVNVIPFGIDQMEGASGEEISSYIYWYYWTRNFNFGTIVQATLQLMLLKYCIDGDPRSSDRQMIDFSVMLFQMLFITAAICLDFTFSTKLHKDVKLHSTVKKVKNITAFILRHSQPVGHRRAHTFTYETPPARSDFAKNSYGGHFEEDEVEEVVSFWRIIVILLAGSFGVFVIQTVSLVRGSCSGLDPGI